MKVSDFTRAEQRSPVLKKVLNQWTPRIEKKVIDLFNKVDNLRVETGEFGQDMSVMSINDGPVNLIIDSAR